MKVAQLIIKQTIVTHKARLIFSWL